jgi:1,2-diacylglycerol 3-alpha-glucosyltransferase
VPMRSLSIAMVAPCPFPTSQGTQVFIGQLARALHRRGHRVHLVTYHYGEEGLDGRLNGVGLYRSRSLPLTGKLTSGPSFQKPFFDLLLTAKLDQVVRRSRADLIHAHNYEGLLAGLVIGHLRKVPVIFHTHNTMMDELPSYRHSHLGRKMARLLGNLLDGQLPRRAQACIAVTPQIAHYIRHRGVSPGQARAIPPAVNEDPFPATISSQRSAGPPTVLYAGNLDRYQNLDFVIHSFGKVLSRRPDCRLRVITHAPAGDVARAARRWRSYPGIDVIRVESFEALLPHLQACDVVLCPRISPYGFPIKLLNYLAAGKPVVACRSSAQGIEHLHNGLVAEDNDLDGFAEAVLNLLEDEPLRRRLSANARRTAREMFSWETLIPRYEEVYRKTLERWNA